VNAIWESATDDALTHQIRKHGPEFPLVGSTWSMCGPYAGNVIKAEYIKWACEAVAEPLRHGSIGTWASQIGAGRVAGNRPQLVMPLLMEPRPRKLGKEQLVNDCRPLNGQLDKWPFCMDNQKDFAKQPRHIAPAYHHVEIAFRH